MRCPRCDVQLERPELIRHLWQEHRLLVDGQEAREPWAVLEDWLADAVQRENAALLARCLDFAPHIDSENGTARLNELLSVYRFAETRSLQDLLSRAQRQRGSMCPHCGTLTASPPEIPIPTLVFTGTRLAGNGYLIALSDVGPHTLLQIETPDATIHLGPEPWPRWTKRTALLRLVGPPVIVAFVVAVALALFRRFDPGIMGLLLCVALVAFVAVEMRFRLGDSAADRLFDHAWTELVPKLHSPEFSQDDSAFLAALAEVSGEHGHPERREKSLAEAIRSTERAIADRSELADHLVALWRLAVEDGARLGRDAVVLCARQVNRVLEGSVPVSVLDRFLTNADEGWTGHQARLRLLICARAFEAGMTVGDLVEAGRLSPAFGEVLNVKNQADLAGLHHLASLGSSRSWEEVSTKAVSVFELANDPNSGEMEKYPDLLLSDRVSMRGREGASEELPIRICGRGVVFRNTVFAAAQVVSVKQSAEAGSFELVVGTSQFAYGQDPTSLADALQRWFDWYFEEFVPAAAALEKEPGSSVEKLRQKEARACSACGKMFIPQTGKVGSPLDQSVS